MLDVVRFQESYDTTDANFVKLQKAISSPGNEKSNSFENLFFFLAVINFKKIFILMKFEFNVL